ncbi:MAG: HEPN domain-containing protein [Candidatus Omnitrophica bacterium]|nr:HEPN domain-containing protein [Candidatus Omnitrophota bacterium]
MTGKQEYLKRWVDKADNDLKVAEHENAIEEKQRVTEAICFHCQQAIEKYLKAYLVFKAVDFGKTHNLEYLIELCAKENKEFLNLSVGNLSFFAVEVRYPDDFYIPTSKEAIASIEMAKQIRDFVLPKISSTTT